jgi:NAD(P)-dependent dehydrogenase (short-subunit alcohol dehydrogenase family)
MYPPSTCSRPVPKKRPLSRSGKIAATQRADSTDGMQRVRNLAGSRLDILVSNAGISNNTTTLLAVDEALPRRWGAICVPDQLRAKLSSVIKNRLMPWA